ncbi:hypothetical protein DFJ74DRAFT_737323, partial [Hyaloraphidium curvatum]
QGRTRPREPVRLHPSRPLGGSSNGAAKESRAAFSRLYRPAISISASNSFMLLWSSSINGLCPPANHLHFRLPIQVPQRLVQNPLLHPFPAPVLLGRLPAPLPIHRPPRRDPHLGLPPLPRPQAVVEPRVLAPLRSRIDAVRARAEQGGRVQRGPAERAPHGYERFLPLAVPLLLHILHPLGPDILAIPPPFLRPRAAAVVQRSPGKRAPAVEREPVAVVSLRPLRVRRGGDGCDGAVGERTGEVPPTDAVGEEGGPALAPEGRPEVRGGGVEAVVPPLRGQEVGPHTLPSLHAPLPLHAPRHAHVRVHREQVVDVRVPGVGPQRVEVPVPRAGERAEVLLPARVAERDGAGREDLRVSRGAERRGRRGRRVRRRPVFMVVLGFQERHAAFVRPGAQRAAAVPRAVLDEEDVQRANHRREALQICEEEGELVRRGAGDGGGEEDEVRRAARAGRVGGCPWRGLRLVIEGGRRRPEQEKRRNEQDEQNE